MLGDLLFEGLAVAGEWVLDSVFGDDENDEENAADENGENDEDDKDEETAEQADAKTDR